MKLAALFVATTLVVGTNPAVTSVAPLTTPVSDSTDNTATWSAVSGTGYADGEALLYYDGSVEYVGVVTSTDHFYRVPVSGLTGDDLALVDDAYATFPLRLEWTNGNFASIGEVP